MRVLHSGFKPYMVCITSLWFDKIICNLMKYWLLKYSFVIWKMWKAEWTKFLNKIIEHTHDHYNWNCTWTDKNRIALSWGLILSSYVAAESCQLSSEILGQPTWMEVWVGTWRSGALGVIRLLMDARMDEYMNFRGWVNNNRSVILCRRTNLLKIRLRPAGDVPQVWTSWERGLIISVRFFIVKTWLEQFSKPIMQNYHCLIFNHI